MADGLDKKFYKIKDVSDFLGVPQSTLRFWEKEFPDCAPRRNNHNVRYYTSDEIKKLQIIKYLLKDRGLKIEAAKIQMETNAENVSRTVKVMELLKRTRSELQAMLDALEKRK